MSFSDDEPTKGTGLITIPKDVFLTISKHVLSFSGFKVGNNQEWREVMGLLVGRTIAGSVNISEAVPFSEGGHDDVKFDYSDYVKMASLEPDFNLRDPPEFFVGWYHSHFIGHTYSGIDIHNHLGWQNNLNPHAFGLVFDPQLLSWDNPGFICLRLENPELEQASKLEYIDYVIPKLSKEDRRDYEAFLKRELPECF